MNNIFEDIFLLFRGFLLKEIAIPRKYKRRNYIKIIFVKLFYL